MPKVSEQDKSTINHINFVADSIHQFGDDLYEDLMQREHDEAKIKAQKLIKVLADLIQSLSDEI
tara:strand:- start:1194 stop:1385 length:192 start_codon:yes stop_codon:yes gene_type:complete